MSMELLERDETLTAEEQLEDWLRLCGCSESAEVFRVVRRVLRQCEEQQWAELREEQRLATEPAHYYVLMNWLDGLDLIEHGTAIRCSWPTEKGRQVLALLDEWANE